MRFVGEDVAGNLSANTHQLYACLQKSSSNTSLDIKLKREEELQTEPSECDWHLMCRIQQSSFVCSFHVNKQNWISTTATNLANSRASNLLLLALITAKPILHHGSWSPQRHRSGQYPPSRKQFRGELSRRQSRSLSAVVQWKCRDFCWFSRIKYKKTAKGHHLESVPVPHSCHRTLPWFDSYF